MRNKKWVRKVIDFIKDDLLDPGVYLWPFIYYLLAFANSVLLVIYIVLQLKHR